MTWNKETGTLGGMPVKSGTYDVFLVSGSGPDTKMMRTTVEVAGFDPIVGYVGVDFAWTGTPMDIFEHYKNLPSGLKWTAAAGTLAGIPTKAGDFSRSTIHGDPVRFTIESLPSTAVGTFNGTVAFEGAQLPLVVTATAAGKLTAKITSGTKTISYSVKSWSSWRRNEEGHLVFSATLTSKNDVMALTLDSALGWTEQALTVSVTGGTFAGAAGSAEHNSYGKVGKEWENASAHEFALGLVGTYSFDAFASEDGWRLAIPQASTGTLKVQVKETGTVSISGKVDGKSYSATTTLRSDGSVFFYVKGVTVRGVIERS